jgi:hypothetical protein
MRADTAGSTRRLLLTRVLRPLAPGGQGTVVCQRIQGGYLGC